VFGRFPTTATARSLAALAIILGSLLWLASPARALPPPNDNRATPEVIPSFPATIQGTTVEATVERLDPQVSDCGRIEGTVWYRINLAPDGTIVLDAQGAGFAPVLRVYNCCRTASRSSPVTRRPGARRRRSRSSRIEGSRPWSWSGSALQRLTRRSR